jgi:hypothetical protein
MLCWEAELHVPKRRDEQGLCPRPWSAPGHRPKFVAARDRCGVLDVDLFRLRAIASLLYPEMVDPQPDLVVQNRCASYCCAIHVDCRPRLRGHTEAGVPNGLQSRGSWFAPWCWRGSPRRSWPCLTRCSWSSAPGELGGGSSRCRIGFRLREPQQRRKTEPDYYREHCGCRQSDEDSGTMTTSRGPTRCSLHANWCAHHRACARLLPTDGAGKLFHIGKARPGILGQSSIESSSKV